ncbi:MAG: ABC transporter permease [Chloroflexi bacterium]|nr:ABC transporter permease [Chloroflexota bacterium]
MSLLRYIGARFGMYLIVLFVGLTILFIVPRLMPSDPIEGYLMRVQNQTNITLSPEEVARIRASLEDLYGIGGSLSSQYVGFLKRVVTLDFGPSMNAYPRPVREFIIIALPYTMGLLLTSTLISWILGNLVGLLAGFFNNSKWATVMETIGVVLYPIPFYILALVLIILFAYVWPMFPLVTTIRPGPLTLEKFAEIIRNSILPGLTMVLSGFGWNILGMKALAFSTKEEAFVNFARLKRVPNGLIMTRYVFRNAILPQVTALALSIGGVFNGALITEMLFSYPGLGTLMRTAVANSDYNMLYGTISLSIVAVATAAFIIDLLYPIFDPRIRYS